MFVETATEIRMIGQPSRRRLGLWVMGAALGASCSPQDVTLLRGKGEASIPSEAASPLGSASLALGSFEDLGISSVEITLEGPGGFGTQTRSILLLNGVQPTVFFGGLPVGSYFITVLAGECVGTGVFEVEADVTTAVSVTVRCDRPVEPGPPRGSARIAVELDAGPEPCTPNVVGISATPAALRVGSTVESSVELSLLSESETIWSADGGVLSGVSPSSRRLACVEPGTIQVTVDVGAGECHEVAMVQVECLGDPPPDVNPRSVVHLAAGAFHTCAILADRSTRCWGWSEYSQLGYGSGEDIGDDEVPASVRDLALPPAREIAAGDPHSCALLTSGSVRCWGWSDYGQLGVPDRFEQLEAGGAADVDLGRPAQKLAAGWTYTCAILDSGDLHCWGDGFYGSLGYANTDNIGDDETPASAGKVDLGGAAVDVSAMFLNTCAVLSGGEVLCWGANGSNFSGRHGVGALGYANREVVGDDETPASVGPVDVGGPVRQIAVGSGHTCALLTDGAVRCWGDGRQGQLGYGVATVIGDDEHPSTAGNVDVGGTVLQLAAGMDHTCALLDNGSVRCWGVNAAGQLGYGNTENVGDDETPAAAGDVPVGSPVQQIVAGGDHTCALLTTGAVRCWGSAEFGQLGYGSTQNVGDDETPASVGDVEVAR